MQSRNDFKCEPADLPGPAHQHDAHGATEAARLDAAVTAERARLAAAGGAPDGRLVDLLHRQGAAQIAAAGPAGAVACWAEAGAIAAAPAPQRAAVLVDLGRLHLALGEPAQAAAPLDLALSLLDGAADADGPAGRDRIDALAARAAVHQAAGATVAAIGLLAEAAAAQEARVMRTQQVKDAVPLAHILLDLGRARDNVADPEAAASYAACVEVTAALVAADPTPDARNMHAAALNHLGRAALRAGKPAALDMLRRSAAAMRQLVDEDGRADLRDDCERAEADAAAAEAALRRH